MSAFKSVSVHILTPSAVFEQAQKIRRAPVFKIVSLRCDPCAAVMEPYTATIYVKLQARVAARLGSTNVRPHDSYFVVVLPVRRAWLCCATRRAPPVMRQQAISSKD